jgi:hypothetical protein
MDNPEKGFVESAEAWVMRGNFAAVFGGTFGEWVL